MPDCMIKMYDHWQKFTDGAQDFSGWVYVMTHNVFCKMGGTGAHVLVVGACHRLGCSSHLPQWQQAWMWPWGPGLLAQCPCPVSVPGYTNKNTAIIAEDQTSIQIKKGDRHQFQGGSAPLNFLVVICPMLCRHWLWQPLVQQWIPQVIIYEYHLLNFQL